MAQKLCMYVCGSGVVAPKILCSEPQQTLAMPRWSQSRIETVWYQIRVNVGPASGHSSCACNTLSVSRLGQLAKGPTSCFRCCFTLPISVANSLGKKKVFIGFFWLGSCNRMSALDPLVWNVWLSWDCANVGPCSFPDTFEVKLSSWTCRRRQLRTSSLAGDLWPLNRFWILNQQEM